ncbi:MAG: DUF928 domain-containing protein [Leptolyngbyaceae cyanobacterium bins.349]|nr:DUF928 domain-containing protein [Leptolyngbyaceae cyanobacterium bins.349]
MSHLNLFGFTAFVTVGLLSTVAWEPGRNVAIQVGTLASASQPQPVRWSPERSRGSVGGTLSGGRRGTEATCGAATDRPTPVITLLVPGSGDGLLTTSPNPTFHWYAETQAAIDMTFVLQHPDEATPIYKQTLQLTRSGMVSVALPTRYALETGTPYRWSVFFTCAHNAGEVVARSFIQRIDKAELHQQTEGRSPLEQGAIFARAGVWYDAVSRLVMAYQKAPQNPEIKTGLQSLLQQAESEQSGQRLTLVSNKL